MCVFNEGVSKGAGADGHDICEDLLKTDFQSMFSPEVQNEESVCVCVSCCDVVGS